MRGEITTLWHRTKFNFQPYAGGENNFPLLESWVDQRVMIQEQDTTTFWAWGFESFRVHCQDIASRSPLAVNHKTVAEFQATPSHKRNVRFFIFPAWFIHSRRKVDAFPHTWDLFKSSWQGMFSCTLCPSIHMCYKRRRSPRRDVHGLASAPPVTREQTKSSNLPVPQFLLDHEIASILPYFTGLLLWW